MPPVRVGLTRRGAPNRQAGRKVDDEGVGAGVGQEPVRPPVEAETAREEQPGVGDAGNVGGPQLVVVAVDPRPDHLVDGDLRSTDLADDVGHLRRRGRDLQPPVGAPSPATSAEQEKGRGGRGRPGRPTASPEQEAPQRRGGEGDAAEDRDRRARREVEGEGELEAGHPLDRGQEARRELPAREAVDEQPGRRRREDEDRRGQERPGSGKRSDHGQGYERHENDLFPAAGAGLPAGKAVLEPARSEQERPERAGEEDRPGKENVGRPDREEAPEEQPVNAPL